MYEQLRLDNQLCFRIYTASRLLTQAYRPLLEPLGLTYPQYLVMMVLWEKDNQLVGDICQRLRLDTNTLTPMLQRMEKEGLVIRTRGIADGRQTLVSLTRKGHRLEEQAKEVPSCLTRGMQDTGVSLDDLQRLATTLDTLTGVMEKTKEGRH
jgi:DNA-binding MarR family transcriptional regulator